MGKGGHHEKYKKSKDKCRIAGLQLQRGGKSVSGLFIDILKQKAEVKLKEGDFYGDDGLIYCGRCRKPKQAFFSEDKRFGDFDRHPVECDCQKRERLLREREAEIKRHDEVVARLKSEGFTDLAMLKWTFENDSGRCPQMKNALFYVDNWEKMRDENIGYLLWGNVGTGKSYFAGCIANALMEKEVPVRMTNFAMILNDLTAGFEGRNGYIDSLCRFPLLIIDDFGMERGTEYALEQVYNVIDSRYRSGRPLIVTTNLTLEELKNPQDTPHARIYDRLLSMCAPILFSGDNFRRETARGKLERLRGMMG